ncbi:hypothetical protein ACS0PU_012033 [Formica fusca]
MGLQGYSNIYMLILLLSAIAMINVQSVPKGHSGENTSGPKHNDSHDSNVSTGDDKNKSNISSNTDHNKSKSDTTSSSISDDEDISDTSSSNDDNKSDISDNTSNENGKNDTITGKDIEHDIIIITGCILRTRIIGTLLMHITQLTKVVFVFLPSLRIPVINYFNNVCAFVINLLIQFNDTLQVIVELLMPLLI